MEWILWILAGVVVLAVLVWIGDWRAKRSDPMDEYNPEVLRGRREAESQINKGRYGGGDLD